MRTDSWEDWTETQQTSLVAKILSSELTVKDACERHALSPELIREWVLRYRRSARAAFDDQLSQTLASQGIDAADLHAAEFTGALADIPISDLLQTLALARKDGVITVSHRGEESRIWCLAGDIVDAESGRLTGVHAVYRILSLEHGQVRADFRSVQRMRVVRASMPALLLDALHRKDQSAPLRQRLGDEGVVYCQSTLALTSALPVEAEELNTLRLFAEGCTIDQALANSGRGGLETLQAVVHLADQGYLLANELLTRSRMSLPPPEPVAGAGLASNLLAHVVSGTPERPRGRPKGRVAIALACAAGLAGALVWGWSRSSPGSLDSSGAGAFPAPPTLAVPAPAAEPPVLVPEPQPPDGPSPTSGADTLEPEAAAVPTAPRAARKLPGSRRTGRSRTLPMPALAPIPERESHIQLIE
ncbi:MAG: DUF4388 domain-containing protein [Deltaproteobacteria bacterium]